MKDHFKNIFKRQKITIVFLSLFLSISVFSQDEQNTSAQSTFPEIANNLNADNEEEICSIDGNKCFTRKELLEIIAVIKTSEFSPFGKIEAYFLLGDYNSLFETCNKLAGGGLEYQNCTIYRGFSYLQKGKFQDAFEIFDNILKRHSDNSLSNYGRGKVYVHRRNYDEALADFSRALEKDHRFSKAYFERGMIYLKNGKDLLNEKNTSLAEIELKNALDDFNSVIEIDLNKTTPETYRRRADVYELLGDEFHAEQDRNLAKELSQRNK